MYVREGWVALALSEKVFCRRRFDGPPKGPTGGREGVLSDKTCSCESDRENCVAEYAELERGIPPNDGRKAEV